MNVNAPQSKRSFALLLEYDGSGYHGWQRQHGVMSIQEMVESKLAVILGEPVTVRASGRTDAGVHALGQVAHFRARTRLQAADFQRALNSLLPDDIVVLDAAEVDSSFHAQFSAQRKCYHYRILNREAPSALLRRLAWHIRRPLDVVAMRRCLDVVVVEHDFSAFMASGSSVRSTVRTIYRATVWRESSDLLVFSFEANGFLRHMVRNLVGTLVDVGRGRYGLERFEAILKAGDRREAGMTAPAHGLYLVRVDYGEVRLFEQQQRRVRNKDWRHEIGTTGPSDQAVGDIEHQRQSGGS